MLKLIVALPLLVGCGSVAVAPDAPVLSDHDFDDWNTQQPSQPKPDKPPVQGPVINSIVDRVIEHIDSVDAQVHFKQKSGQWEAAAEAAPKPTPPARTLNRNLAPPPAPAADMMLAAAPLTLVEQDAARHAPSFTGAIIYSAPWCGFCQNEISDLKQNGWIVGTSGNVHFLVVELQTAREFKARGMDAPPHTVYFRNGREIPRSRIRGYGGNLDAIERAHPSFNPKARAEEGAPVEYSREEYRNPLYGAAYLGSFAQVPCPCGPGCVCVPGAQCGCLAAPYNRAPLGYSIGPAQSSASLSLFGMPLIAGSVGTFPMTCGPGGCH